MIARVWVNVRLVWSHPVPAMTLLLSLVLVGFIWRYGSPTTAVGPLFAVWFASQGIAAVQRDVMRSSFAFVLPGHESVLRAVVLGFAMLSGMYLVEAAHDATLAAVAAGSRLPDAALFAFGAAVSLSAVFLAIAAGDRSYSMGYLGAAAAGYAIGWFAKHPSVALLVGGASIASAWYLLQGRALNRWVLRSPYSSDRLPAGLWNAASRSEATRHHEGGASRRPYAKPIWMAPLLEWMRSPRRSPSLRAIAGDLIERLGGRRASRGHRGIAGVLFLVLWGYAAGNPAVTLPAWARAAPAWMVAILVWSMFGLPRSRLVTALPLGRRVLFATQVVRNLLAAIVAVLLFEGSDMLSDALAPYMPVLSGYRFASVGYSGQLAATVASIGLVPPLLEGRVANFMAQAFVGLAWIGLQYFVVAPGLFAGFAVCAATWGFGLIMLRDRYRRASLV